jgi:xanthine dehydrogenase accessory factor
MTHRDDRALANALADVRSEGRSCALATIVATRGSTPRKVGARMLVDPERGLVGTVGGGCGEAEVIEAAARVLRSGRPERVRVDLTDDMLSWSPAVCGGIMDVFVEAVGLPGLAEIETAPRISGRDPEG